ncbi:MAG: hypothetical protein JRD68_15845 [Deltaproteobacteria bacterium]|nr:hypothetical protein [Deltaproteobacteria bacterium]
MLRKERSIRVHSRSMQLITMICAAALVITLLSVVGLKSAAAGGFNDYNRLRVNPIQGRALNNNNMVSSFRQGFGSNGFDMYWNELLYTLLIFTVLIVAVLLLRMWLKPEVVNGFGQSGSNRIIDRREIMDLVEQSIDMRSLYELQIDEAGYEESFKCPILGISEDNLIEVECGSPMIIGQRFDNRKIRVNLRVTSRESDEFYQFDTTSKNIARGFFYGRTMTLIRLALPSYISRDQKRQHHRVTPTGKFAFDVNLLDPPGLGKTMPSRGFRPLHEARITDISAGGMKVTFKVKGEDIKVRYGQEVCARFTLPTATDELEMPEGDKYFLVRARVVSVQRGSVGKRRLRVMSKDYEAITPAPYSIKLMFIDRGIVDRETRTVMFRPAGSFAFQDLSRWITSYQRFRVLQEKDTLRKPPEGKNLYPRVALEVKPKYPAQQVEQRVAA